jgi:hypothetical protein
LPGLCAHHITSDLEEDKTAWGLAHLGLAASCLKVG